MAKIILLTVSHGAAHRRVAAALEQALRALDPSLAIRTEDMLAHTTPWFRAYYNSYEIPLRYWPALWGWIEGMQHDGRSTGPGWLYRRGAQPLFRFLKDSDPDLVIATEVGACELAALHKREHGARFKLVGATAGVDVDRPWAQPEVDLYPVAPGEPAESLERAGVPPEKILRCGLPVDPGFAAVGDRHELRERLELRNDLPLVLVMFGGTGFGKAGRIVDEMKALRRPVQTVYIAGRNARLEDEVRRRCSGLAYAKALGWVSNMHEWMAAADLLVSKPGGTTVLEAINSGLPLLALDPLPGAERRACELIERWGVGCYVRRAGDLTPTLVRLLAHPEEAEAMRRQARARARPHAAAEAAAAILKLLENRMARCLAS
ncbi:MAG TPA: glycosyltransferase [Terriglobia bacterium]|nr:glycosyltransferase [Terriglobia bacterium]